MLRKGRKRGQRRRFTATYEKEPIDVVDRRVGGGFVLKRSSTFPWPCGSALLSRLKQSLQPLLKRTPLLPASPNE